MRPYSQVVAELERELAVVGDRLRRDQPGQVSPEHLEKLRLLRNRMMLALLASSAVVAWTLLAGAVRRAVHSSRGAASGPRRRPA